jgi:putative ABC transport system ATP-binding protein
MQVVKNKHRRKFTERFSGNNMNDLSSDSIIREPGTSSKMQSTDRFLLVNGLTRQVPSGDAVLTLLDDISFQVSAGMSLAILGASGSGKTTLLGLLAGLDVPTQGSVQIDGRDLNDYDEDGRAALRAELIGFVFQNFQLLAGLTALENVMLPLELLQEPHPRRTAEDLLQRVGLGERFHHYPNQLSGGEQQRCAIARAFVTRPRCLIADEPTGNLDSETGQRIIDLLFELNEEQGTTLIMATHDAALASRCRQRIRLQAGRLIENLTNDTTDDTSHAGG